VTPTLALLTLLLASSDAVPPEPAGCQSFTRASANSPPFVRDWLARSSDERVLACTPPAGDAASPLYTGESAVARQGAVCSYHSHGLVKVGGSAQAHLERYERSDALRRALADGDCPAPHTAAAGRDYVTTYDISPQAFVALMRLWAELTASTAAFDRACGGPYTCGRAHQGAAPSPVAGDTQQRLRAAIDNGRMQTAAVARIVRMSGSTLRRRYALFVVDPDRPADQPGFYVIYLSKRLRGPYQLTGIADTLG
jgi:hypothetical protein